MSATPDLAMLWEAADAPATLTTRFGFADADHAVSWLSGVLAEVWGARLTACERIVMSADNLLAWLTVDDRRVIAKCCVNPTSFALLAKVDALVAWLGAEDLPVAAAIAASDGRLRAEHDRFSIGLYPVMSGELLDVTIPHAVEAAGRTLAALHRALARYPGLFDGDPDSANRQLVHGDFRAANVLCNGAMITAVLDFDETTRRSRVTELARSAVLLATRYHDWRPTDRRTRDTFIAAYTDVAPLTSTEGDGLHRGITAVLAHFGWS